ncbi:hypothetical protein [Microbacterium sp. BDGP8]|uniref:hypothetical protein n=1 Tax=Microbacterium sp. BDGP8 TaxID=3035531 RepID=UPI00249E57CB|nr:hypothetical protein [Microbacterium sp. BDGP8]WHE37835.1 hypothetical protein P6897_16020 [Microbacterium sp. BDGP8]
MLTPEAGVYAAIPVCRPSDWLQALEHALALPSVEALRRRLRVAGPATVLAAAAEWAASADRATGRDVAVSHATVAERIGYAEATVKRIMRFLSRLGFVVECARGRNRLTLDELAAARSLGAVQQRAAASTRALTIPRSVDGTPLPLSRTVSKTSHLQKNSPKRARGARRAGATRRPAEYEDNKAATRQPRWPLEVQRFAAQLVDRLPRLLRTRRSRPTRAYVRPAAAAGAEAVWVGGRHIGQVCDAIARHRLLERGWTVEQLLERVDRHRAGMRHDLEPAEQRDPLAWLFWLVSQAVPADELAPAARSQLEREQQLARAAARAAEEAALRERIAAEQPEIDAILAKMRGNKPRRSAAGHGRGPRR